MLDARCLLGDCDYVGKESKIEFNADVEYYLNGNYSIACTEYYMGDIYNMNGRGTHSHTVITVDINSEELLEIREIYDEKRTGEFTGNFETKKYMFFENYGGCILMLKPEYVADDNLKAFPSLFEAIKAVIESDNNYFVNERHVHVIAVGDTFLLNGFEKVLIGFDKKESGMRAVYADKDKACISVDYWCTIDIRVLSNYGYFINGKNKMTHGYSVNYYVWGAGDCKKYFKNKKKANEFYNMARLANPPERYCVSVTKQFLLLAGPYVHGDKNINLCSSVKGRVIAYV